MSSIRTPINRKRLRIPDFGEICDTEESPQKKCKTEQKSIVLPSTFRDNLKRLSQWFRELQTGQLNMSKFGQMTLKYGTRIRKNTEFDGSEDDEEEEEEDDDIKELDVLDDDIQEIKENVQQESLSPLIKKLGSSRLSSPNESRRSKFQSAANGSCYLDSYRNSPQKFGFRELSTRVHGTTNCSLRRETTDKLKRKPLVSSPPTEVEMVLGTEPEVVAVESDGIEILSESSSSNQNSSQKPFRGLGKSSRSSASVPKSSPYKRSTLARRVYTANEVVRLQEKAQYKLLLEKYVNEPLYHRVCDKKPELDEDMKDDKTKLFLTSHFKKEILQQPISSFLEKYYTPCRLLTPKSEKTSEIKKEPPVEITIDDEDDTDLRIVDVTLPKFKPEYKSTLFTKAWLTELRQNVHAQTKERNKIVEDHERQLEKLRAERLLRRLKADEVAARKDVEPEFPELTPEMEEAIDSVLNTGGPNDVIVTKSTGDNICRKDLETLIGLHWLNDNIINSYFDLILERSKEKEKENYPSVYAFNTFFYVKLKGTGYLAVRRWTRKADIFSFDINFVPLHISYHWCLAVIDHRSKKISYYDSMGSGEECCLDYLHNYLCEEYKDKKGKILDPNLYTKETMKGIPQQMNGSDCGMFSLKFAEYLSRDAEINFDQDQMQYFRRRTIYELLTSKLL